MDDEKFWKIADKYELEGDDGQPYIPRKNWTKAAKAVAVENNYDYNESYADIKLLFNYTVPKEVQEFLEILCLKEKK